MSSIKREAHNILHCPMMKNVPQPQLTRTENFTKFGHVALRHASGQTTIYRWTYTDKTNKHADHNTLRPSQAESVKIKGIKSEINYSGGSGVHDFCNYHYGTKT